MAPETNILDPENAGDSAKPESMPTTASKVCTNSGSKELAREEASDSVEPECMPVTASRISTTFGSEESLETMPSVASSRQHSTFSCMKEKEKVVMFQPGRIGIDYEEDTVTFVEVGGQADEAGVAIGWRMLRLNETRCTFFGDDMMVAALQGTLPFEITFVVDIQCESNEAETGNLHSSSKQALIVPSCIDNVMEGKSVENLRENCEAQPITTLVVDIQCESNEHETSCSHSPSNKALIVPSCIDHLVEGNSLEEPVESCEATQIETPTATPPATPPVSPPATPRAKAQNLTRACDTEDLKNTFFADQEADYYESVATIIDANSLTMNVPKMSERKEFLSPAVAAAAKNEEEGKQLLAALGAKISSREQELERKLALAESMIRQIQEREIDHELGITDDDELGIIEDEDQHAGQSFTSCGTSPFDSGGSWFRSKSFWGSGPENQSQSFWLRWFNTNSTTASV